MKIELILNPGKGERRLELKDFPAFIGRGPECPVHIDDRQASRSHASIERRGKKLCLVDHGSSNGTSVNGIVSKECFLDPGDEIRIGETKIRVEKVIRDPIEAAAHGEERLLRAPRLPLLSRIAAPAILVLIAAAVVFSVYSPKEKAPPEPPSPAEPAVQAPWSRAEEELLTLKRDAAKSPRITADLIERAERLAEESGGAAEGGEDPFAEFLLSLRSRQRLEVQNRLFRLEEELKDLLERKKYAEALERVGAVTKELRGEGLLSEEDAAKRILGVEGEVRAASKILEEQAARLEELERDEELKRLCEGALAQLGGTSFAEKFQVKLLVAESRLQAAEERKKVAEEKSAKAAGEAQAAAAMVPPPPPEGLWAHLAPAIAAGAFKEKIYRLAGFEGTPAGIKEGKDLAFRGPKGERTIPLEEVPAEVQLQMARDALSGERLIEAADFGYQVARRKEADAILMKYLSEGKGSRAERQAAVDRWLASRRGLNRVPEGGFTYDPEKGFEYGMERADRLSREETNRLAGIILGCTDPAVLEKSFQAIQNFLEDPKLSTQGRVEVRQIAIGSLGGLRSRLIEQLEGVSKRKGFANLRTLKEELNRRRAAALAIIYDLEVYLPENHPDHERGDVVNGQKAVDDAVAAVREMWDQAGSFAMTLEPAVRNGGIMIDAIDSSYYEKLYHKSQDKDSEDLREVLNNLQMRIDVRSYAASRAEAELYRYNRKVDAYNRSLADPELSEAEKAHVEILNDYREMLGRRRLFIDLRLCRAAGKHSLAQSRRSRIWHQGPDGTPDSRARAEGYDGNVTENAAIGHGNPKDIWVKGWYRASDHHRNALGAGHTTIGYGYAGNVGTQNFGAIPAPFATTPATPASAR